MNKEDKKEDNLYKLRHTLAHVLAKAVLEFDQEAKLAIGPPVDNGFYYDFEFSKEVGESELKDFNKKMKKIISAGFEPSVKEISIDEAKEMFKDQPYKLELIDEIAENGESITIYDIAGFVDLCEGPHVASSKDIEPKAFKLDKLAGAYWRGDENNKMLTRVYGLAFETPEELKEYQEFIEEAKKRDHRKIGQKMQLFTISDKVGAGLPLFTPKGTLMRDLVTDKIWQLQKKYGWQRVTIPHITKPELYKISGHWEKFGDELFKVQGKAGAEFVMKPMNCPHHTQIYAAFPKSYKDLPVRYAENGVVYRDEQAGELLGLARVRAITQDDGHAFVTPEQIEDEVKGIVSIIKQFYTDLGMLNDGDYWVSLSVSDPEHPEKYLIEEDGLFLKAEKILEKIAQDENLPYKKVEGEAAFYGPKLDFQFKDSLGREWQLGTVQLDFNMPKRFGLEYTDKDGQKKTPVMIHRAIAGSLERFMAVMLEHTAGNFPVWLSPVQVYVLPIADTHEKYAQSVVDFLKEKEVRVEILPSNDSLGKRIRKFKEDKVPFALVLGDNEEKNNTVGVESRDEGKIGEKNLEDFLGLIK